MDLLIDLLIEFHIIMRANTAVIFIDHLYG